MQNFINAITNFCTSVQPLAKPLMILSMIVGGICLIIPSEEFHHKAMKVIPFALVGFAVVMCALELGASYASNF